MALRFYLVPEAFYTLPGTSVQIRYPKYFTPDLLRVNASFQDFGAEPVFLVAADVTPAQHTALAANADVAAAPSDLTTTVGGNLATVRAKLTAFKIPNDWITSGMTWATVLRWIWRLGFLMQRFQRFGQFFQSLDLASTVSDLPQQRRTNLATAAQSLGLDTSGITGTMTLQDALKLLGNQIAVPAKLAGVTL
jgi:hypothetical protein